ncbi:MAG: Maf family nucleotide pyrophosphatase [Bacteroides sp.]|jgi:septum formation protein|nr:Maf family nucleotide pyrophosphatase [Bacteroides sp.]
MQFFESLKSFDIILASQSPRRRDLLAQTGIPFRVLVKPISEDFPVGLCPQDVALRLSREKAGAFAEELKSENIVIMAADTIVVDDGKIINKPGDHEHAVRMLRSLSGKDHQVITGVCIRHREKEKSFFETTRVFFRVLKEEEIQYYVTTYKPFDKAGAYGIQEWIGHVGIHHIEGSYLNVVGLPVERVFTELKALLGHQ